MIQPLKYPKIPRLAGIPQILKQEVEIYEKIDGGNVQMYIDNEYPRLASRSGDPKSPKRPVWWGSFYGKALRFFSQEAKRLQVPFSELISPNLVLFGEWLHPHTILYDDEYMNRCFIIDAWDREQERFLTYQERVDEVLLGETVIGVNTPAPRFNMPAPIFRGRIDMQGIEGLLPGSAYYNGDKEGLVIKAYKARPQLMAKVYNPAYEEVAHEQGLAAYLTHRRLQKVIIGIAEDQGRDLNRATVLAGLLEDLRQEVPTTWNEGEARVWFDRWLRSGGAEKLKREQRTHPDF